MKKLFMLAPAALLLACGGEPETTTTITTPEPEVVELSVDEQIENYLTEKGWTADRHESGIYIVTDTLGTGDERPTLSDDVTIFYQGYLLDGTQFDGTMEEPATFPLANLIEGWQIGIPMFGKGGKGKLVIPSEYGYGDAEVGDIPANSILMFEIELVDWAPSPAAPVM
jgi:FKBP-type peptidyl-prolyl cis-trans isomerase